MFRQLYSVLWSRVCGFSTNHAVIKNVAGMIKNDCNSIMVMVGAGLSTPSGIPDFRTPGSGVYSNLKKYNLPSPEAIFDIDYFERNPQPFLDFAKEIYSGNYKPNVGHYFIYLLQEKQKLLRLYTQNIDGLERLAGIKEKLLVEAHGTFSSASCIKCKERADIGLVKQNVFKGVITQCSYCQVVTRYIFENCKGLVKPDIVFFGEQLPDRYHSYINEDPLNADFLIIIGTSLEVYPFALIPELLPASTPKLLINRELVGNFGGGPHDVAIMDDIVNVIEMLAKELGWWDELDRLMTNTGIKSL